MIWDALVKVALIGTDRSSLPEEEKEKLRSLGLDPDLDASQAILEAAAFYAPIIKAGFQTKKWKGPLPKPAIEEDQNPCSAKSANHLALMLSDRFHAALSEFVELMADYQQHLPPEALPDLLSRCLQDIGFWQLIKPIIGQRGHWLIEQNPEWHFLKEAPADYDWYIAAQEERIALLQQLRRTHPSAALSLIQTTWKEDSIKHRVQYLKTITIRLNKKDEAFLENLLDDRRKEIRMTVAELLAQLPESELVQRMFDRVVDLTKVKKGKGKDKLEIEPPDALTLEMMRDGIGTTKTKIGAKATWLTTMLSAIPPHRWEQQFEKSTAEVLELFTRTNWAPSILEGLKQASAKYHNENWQQHLLLFWIKNQDKPRWDSFSMENILEDISDEVFNAVGFEALKKNNSFGEEDSPLGKLLRSGNHRWTDKLFLLFLKSLQNWLSSSAARYWEGWQYRSVLKKAAYGCSIKMLTVVKKDYDSPGRKWAGWEKDMDEFIRVLRFRKEMTEAISKDNNTYS